VCVDLIEKLGKVLEDGIVFHRAIEQNEELSRILEPPGSETICIQ
jgi:hypothetical protein